MTRALGDGNAITEQQLRQIARRTRVFARYACQSGCSAISRISLHGNLGIVGSVLRRVRVLDQRPK